MSRSRVRLHYRPDTTGSSPRPANNEQPLSLLDDDDLAGSPHTKTALNNQTSQYSDDDSSYSSDDDDQHPHAPHVPAKSPAIKPATPAVSLHANDTSLRMDPRLLNVMDSGQLMPEVRDGLVEEQRHFGNAVSQHDADFARRFMSRQKQPSPISGPPVEDKHHDNKGDYDDEDDDYDDDDYDDDRKPKSYGTRDDGYSSRAPEVPATHHSSESLSERKEQELRKRLRVDYRLLHKSGVVSTKNYNISTTPIELLVDDLEDLHVDDRIEQWTGIVQDIVKYMAKFIEFVNYRFLQGRYALQGYGQFMESRIPALRPKIVRVAGMMVKSGAQINPIVDLLIAFCGQTIMYMGMQGMRQQLQMIGPPSATPFSTTATGPTPHPDFSNMNRQVPDAGEYERNKPPGPHFFQGDQPMYNGNVTANNNPPPPQQDATAMHGNAPENPFASMLSGGNNNMLMNIFNAVTGGGSGGMNAGLGEDFRREISSMLPNGGNMRDFEDAVQQGEQQERRVTISEGNVKPPTIFMTHETSSRKRRNTASMVD